MEKCPKCGASISSEDNFCPECSYKIKSPTKQIEEEERAKIKGRLAGIEEFKEEKLKKEEETKLEKSWGKTKIILLSILALILLIGLLFGGCKIKDSINKWGKASFNELCEKNNDCISEECENGQCTCSPMGGKCDKDSDCCSSHPYCEGWFGKKYCSAYNREYGTWDALKGVFILIIILGILGLIKKK
ncbi:MAG: zinc ribbon domain-containing protein [Nanoarchaeota archaeon]|nr:zinc ribbon domain-containing protein [Nanoarchaeota archaeon]